MKAQDLVDSITERFGSKYNHDKDCDTVIEFLFDMLIDDLVEVLKNRSGFRSVLIPFFDSYSNGLFEKHLGSILKEINLKAEKVNRLGKFGFTENWFQRKFIKEARKHQNAHQKSAWGMYFADCKEMVGVNYPAFTAIKDFLNP
jgi:hypothetical protein